MSQEIDEGDDMPALIMHLPQWESKQQTAKFFDDDTKFRSFFRDQRIIESVEFLPGTEAVFAKYNEGELLIIEYLTPQISSEIDKDILIAAESNKGNYIYRRIGNYNVFLFDPHNEDAAAVLLEQIKYQKVVTWPYGNPKPFFAKEREFIIGAKSLFISTFLFILTILGSAILFGAVCGVLYFRAEDRKRSKMTAFSDAGGLTRLNLDGLTQEMTAEKLLND